METLQERLQREFRNKILDIESEIRMNYTEKSADYMIKKLEDFISHTISETIKEAVRVIEGEKRTSRFTAESAEVMGFNDGLSTAITAVEWLQANKQDND